MFDAALSFAALLVVDTAARQGAILALVIVFLVFVWRRLRTRRDAVANATPTPTPSIARRLWCRAPAAAVCERLRAYETIDGGPIVCEARLRRHGAWTCVEFPKRLHAWHAHNITLWLSECGPVLLVSRGDEPEHRYWLTTEPAGSGTSDWLLGWREDATEPIAVYVPEGKCVRGDDHQAVCPRATTAEALASRALAAVADASAVPCEIVRIGLSDPGPRLNPMVRTSAATRRAVEHSLGEPW